MSAEFNTGALSDYCLVCLAGAASDLPFAFSSAAILCGINLPACRKDSSGDFWSSLYNSVIDFSAAPL